jgi:hypothetical protein
LAVGLPGQAQHHAQNIPLELHIIQPIKREERDMSDLLIFLICAAPVSAVFGWVLSNQHRKKEIGRLLDKIFE